jgi:hypothetical protein
MLRLGVIGGSPDDHCEQARRLRGATLDPDSPPADADAVVLLSEDDSVERLLAKGKHVLLADESVLTGERLAAWGALARPGGPQLAVLNRDRHLPSRQLIRQQLAANLGEPGLVRVHRWSAALSHAHLKRDLDLVLGFLGRAPQVVHALSGHDLLQVHLGFPGGGMALIGHATGPHLADGYSSASVIARNGAAYADDHASRQMHFTGGAVHALRTSEDTLALVAMAQSFVDGLSGGVDLWSSLSAWTAVLAVLDAIAHSLASGRAVQREGD